MLTRTLDLARWAAIPLYNHLKGMGYVVSAAKSHKAGYASTGKPLYVPVRSGPNHENMLEELFDPMIHISHHVSATGLISQVILTIDKYQLPPKSAKQPALLSRQLLAWRSNSMPPPATPASANRKKDAVTPASGLDLRESITPYKTPTRPPSKLVQPTKRTADEEDDDDSPPAKVLLVRSSGRPARGPSPPTLRSITSQFVLNAKGLSSSPAGQSSFY
jgi:hypothetical protein